MPNDEWQTPSYIIKMAREAMGSIDLDPASCKAAQDRVNAGFWYDKESDGLLSTWDGYNNIWLNPPYSQPLASEFVFKAIEHCKTQERQAIILVNNATETMMVHSLFSSASAVCFPQGRISFYLDGKIAKNNRQGQAIFYIGKDQLKFCHKFSEIGVSILLCLP